VRVRRIALVVVLAVAAASLTAFQSGPAHAATVTGLPITSAYQVVAASAQGHIFISQGPDGGAKAPIVVTNLSGTQVGSIGDGAWGMALSANDQTLYAATGDSVTAYSTTTLNQTASYPAPGLTTSVAIQSGRLWVSYRNGSTGALGEVGGIDLTDPSAPWDSVPGEWIGFPPTIAVDPSDSGKLVASGDEMIDGATTATYNVSDPSAVTQIGSSASIACGIDDLWVIPGGGTFLCGDSAYSTATLAANPSDVAYYPGFMAVAPNGAIADGSNGSVLAYPAVGKAATASYDEWYGVPVPSTFTAESASPIGFAWSSSGEQLFTVMQSTNINGQSAYTLLSLYPFERVPAPLTMTSTATTIGYRGSFTVTAHLGVTDTNPDYSVYETIAGHPRQLVGSCPCGLPGSLGTADSLWTTDTTYTAVYTGDALYEPKTVTLDIKVGAEVATALSGYYKTAEVSGLQYHLYHRNATLKDWVTVTPNKQGECVRLEIQQAVKSVWRADATTGCVALNKWSQAAIPRTLSATGWYRVRADFAASAKDTTNVSADGGWLYYVVPS
jgi:hypothetical protein